MPTPNRPLSQNKYPEQYMDNSSFDEDFGINMVGIVGYDGQTMQRTTADAVAVKVTVSGSITYVGIAAPGTTQATAKWQCKKIDESSGTVVTFADGNASFDNTATDLTALTYS